MQISIKLGGPLRQRVEGHHRGEMSLEITPGTLVSHVLRRLGLDGDVVRVLMLNGRPLAKDKELQDGDRLALFPRELAYNLYAAINFFNPLSRPESPQDKND